MMLNKWYSFVFLLLVSSLSLVADDGFKLSSLIVPQGVSCRFTPVRLTRDIKVETGTIDTRIVRSSDASGNSDTNFVGQTVNENKATSDTNLSKNAGVDGSARMDFIGGIIPVPSASVKAHGSIERGSIDLTHAERSSSAKEDAHAQTHREYRNADSVEDTMKGRYGDYYLTFTGTFKNLDISDECYVKPNEGAALGAYVSGLSQPIFVPCTRQDMFAIGLDEVVCKFACPIHDEKLLSEIKSMNDKGGLGGLSVKIDGVSFPIISRATGKNVLNEIKLAEMKNPTTEFVLGVGDAKVLSPWKVKQRFGRASGKRGKNVTIRDALEAINEKVAEDDSMPEHVFEFDTNGALVAVSEIRLGVADKKNDIVLCARFDGDTAGASLRPLDAKILDSPIKSYKNLEFIDLNMDDVVKLYNKDSQKYVHLYHEVINWLRAGKQDDRKVRLALGELLLLSMNADERSDGFNVLKAYWDKHKDISAIEIMIYGYLINPKEFPYKEHIAEWISQLSKSEQWVQSVLEKDVLDDFIADGQTEAIVTLSKLPSFACSSNGVTVLMRIAKSGNVDMVKAVLKECKFDVNDGNGNVGTALEWAAKNDKVKMVEYLIGLGANPSLSFGNNEQYRNAVDMAAVGNAVNVLKYLIEKVGCDAHKAHFCAAEQGASDAFRYLMVKCPINPNSKWDEIPLLSYAAWGGDVTICKCLIDKGAYFDEIDGVRDNNLPISAACTRKKYEVIEYLIDRGAKVPYASLQNLLETSASWVTEKVSEKKIDAGSVLLGAIGLNDTKAVEYYARRVDINVGVGSNKWLPLCWASVCNSVDAARVLVKMGAKVNHSLPDECTPIQQACRAGSLDMIKYLYVECDAILDDALFFALKKKQKAVLDWFLAYEKDGKRMFPVNTFSHGRKGTLLMVAAEMDDPEMCEYLLNKGADIKYSPEGKCSVLEYVIRIDNLPILRYLVDQRGCVVGDEILEAAGNGSMKCLEYLIEEKRMSVNYCSRRKAGFLLGRAAGEGKVDVCRYLVSKGANVNFKPVYESGLIFDDKYKTALQMARDYGNAETVNYLISVGAKE